MRKIPTVFVRDPETNLRYVTDQVHPDCQWVLDGEGVATRKYDGTCVMLDDEGRWWARREVKMGKPAPDGWVLVDHDAVTGKSVGWEPIEQSSFIKFFTEAQYVDSPTESGTYELCGPKINRDPEDFGQHRLIRHADAEVYSGVFRAPENVVLAVRTLGWEGIVWHHPDGRMAKLKGRDYPE